MDSFEIYCVPGEAFRVGRAYVPENGRYAARSVFIKPPNYHWCTLRPVEILASLGIETEPRRAREFADLLDGDLGGFTYLAAASAGGVGDEALKWIMGGLAAALNERSLPFSRVAEVLPADWLNAFVVALSAGKFEKSFAKDLFAALIATPRYHDVFVSEHVEEVPGVCGGEAVFRGTRLSVAHVCGMVISGETIEALVEDFPYLSPESLIMGAAYLVARDEMGWWETRRIPGEAVVAKLAADPRFKAAGNDAIDGIIREVVAANPEQAKKVHDQPKLVGWFVGQVIKAAKAKGLPPLPPPTVQGMLNGYFFEAQA